MIFLLLYILKILNIEVSFKYISCFLFLKIENKKNFYNLKNKNNFYNLKKNLYKNIVVFYILKTYFKKF